MLKKIMLAGLITLWALGGASGAHALIKPGATLPPLKLPDAQGATVDLAALTKGKVAILVYWSVSCPHCRRDMPQLIELNQQMSGNPFVMLMINNDGPAMAQAAVNYAKQYQLPGPVIIDSGPGDSMPLGEAWDVVATPTVLVLDPKGKLVHAQEVQVDMNQIKNALDKAFGM